MKVLEIFERELTSRDGVIEDLKDKLSYLDKSFKLKLDEVDKLKKENASLRQDLYELSNELRNGK